MLMTYFGFGLVLAAILLLLITFFFVAYPGRNIPTNTPEYVALGSSFAAGIGLGPRVESSSLFAGRTTGSYPQKLARKTGVSLVDMTWSGSKSIHILQRGAFFQRPQIEAVSAETKWVTITTGGNDVGYGGDLAKFGYGNKHALLRILIGLISSEPLQADKRDFNTVYAGLTAAIVEIKRRAPKARIVVVTYPPVLSLTRGCEKLGLTSPQISLMLPVAEKLAQVTRDAAADSDVEVLDMAMLGRGHEVCSDAPWTQGCITDETPFHPSNAGTEAIAVELRQLFLSELIP